MDLRKRLLILLLAGPALLAGPGAGDGNEVDLGREGPFAHVQAFQAIATENGGNRASGTPAHLDSVAEGPGINDNGSGSAAVLEAALRLAAIPVQSGKRVRFAFWGAEERGLLGSRHHLQVLPEDERRRIAVYINLDMVGSPNFGRFVQGSTSSAEGPAAVARNALLDHFRAKGLAVEERWGSDRPRSFGSDDASFARMGIPTLGLYTGAAGTKTDAAAIRFGGQANKPYDSCYHRACDNIENIDRGVLESMTEALVSTLGTVAYGQLAPAALDPQ